MRSVAHTMPFDAMAPCLLKSVLRSQAMLPRLHASKLAATARSPTLLPPSCCCPTLQVKTMFTTIVNPEAAAFKSIRSNISCALAAHLLYGRAAMAADGSAAANCSSLLARVGAAALAEDVAELAERLAGVAAVNEAVHGQLLALLAGAGR